MHSAHCHALSCLWNPFIFHTAPREAKDGAFLSGTKGTARPSLDPLLPV